MSFQELRLLDETLREGDSRAYHRHSSDHRLRMMRMIHDITGIEHFSLGFAVVNDSDRETLFAFLRARREGQLPRELVAHVYGWYQIAAPARELLLSIPPEDRSAVVFHSACSASEAIARPLDGPWLAARRGDPAAARLPARELHAALQAEFAELTKGYFGLGLGGVGAILQDAFRCTEDELHGYVAAAVAGGCDEVRLHDTVGVATPLGVAQRLDGLRRAFPGARFYGHFHDDLGMAVANTITALERGAAGADVTINGVGNRAGNASTAAVLLALRVVHGVELPGVAYDRLTELARAVEDYFVMIQSPHAPVTGRLLHLDEATVRTHLMQVAAPTTYLPFDPKLVGGHIEAAYAPGSGKRAVELAFERAGEALRAQGIVPDAGLVERAWAWIQREARARAEAHRPAAAAAMTAYEAALRRSYVTDDDLIARARETSGRFEP